MRQGISPSTHLHGAMLSVCLSVCLCGLCLCDPVLTVPYKGKQEAVRNVGGKWELRPQPFSLILSESLSVTSEEFTNGTSVMSQSHPRPRMSGCVQIALPVTPRGPAHTPAS